jgi:hypothetical protein
MTGAEQDRLRAGACVGLPPAVIDKYFMADGCAERFQFLTAKAICGRCAVQAACLIEAIRFPSGGVRGGESTTDIGDMHRDYVMGRATAESLAASALLRQRRKPGVADSPSLRAGRFRDTPLIPIPSAL